MNFKTFIKAVGTGPKGNRDLSFEESFEAVSQILKQEPTQAQMGAFLIAWRVKLETNEEFKGAIKALNSFIKYKEVPDSLKLGYNFDGRDTNPYLFPLYEDFLQPTKNGISTKDIFTKFDKGQYLHYFDRVEYLQELSNLTTLRNEFGLRTAFNTVEKLLNPSLSEYGVCGAFHKPYVSKYLEMFKDDFKDITVIRGNEGDIEVFKDSKFWQKKDGEIKEYDFCLKDYGVSYSKVFENITLEENLNILRNYDDEILNLAKFNVALYLLFASRVDSLDEAWQRLN